MGENQKLSKQSMQSGNVLTSLDKSLILARLGEVAVLKGLSLDDTQLKIWIKEIEYDLEKGDISTKGILKALREFPRTKSYGGLDYYSFYELAKSSSIDIQTKETYNYLEQERKRKGTAMPEEIKQIVKRSK